MYRTPNGLQSLFKLILALALLIVAGPPTYADPNSAKARELYDDGVTNYNLGHYDEALVAFESAYRVRHDPAFLFNIGQCQRNLHRYEDAERSYRAFLRESPNLSDATRTQIQKLIAEMDIAIQEARAKQPPTGTRPPASSETSTTTAHDQSSIVSSPSNAATAAVVTLQPHKKPVYKRGWFWGVMAGAAVVVIGAGIGIGLGINSPKATQFSVVQF